MSKNPGLADWHRVMAAGNVPDELAQILAEDAVFHSPVVHTHKLAEPRSSPT